MLISVWSGQARLFLALPVDFLRQLSRRSGPSGLARSVLCVCWPSGRGYRRDARLVGQWITLDCSLPWWEAPVLLGGLGVLVVELAVEVHARRLYHELGCAVVGTLRRGTGRAAPLRLPPRRGTRARLRVKMVRLPLGDGAVRPHSSMARSLFPLSPRSRSSLLAGPLRQVMRRFASAIPSLAFLLISFHHIARSLTLTLLVGLNGVVCPICLLLLIKW